MPDLERIRREALRVAKHLVGLQTEALRVFVPLPAQRRVVKTKAKRLVIRGGNRSGKTLSGAWKLADRVCEESPGGARGCALVVSLDLSLLAKNCYEKLFEKGAFLVCKDCSMPCSTCRCGQGFDGRSVPAPPLIPRRLVKRIVWLDKARRIPDRVYLWTGWQIDFRSCESGREKFQGTAYGKVWVDEEGGSDEGVMNEIERGLIETDGALWWTATPLAAGVKLLEMSEKAHEEAAVRATRIDAGEELAGDPRYEEIVLRTDDNTSLPKDAVAEFFAGMSEEEEKVRRGGEFLVTQGLVFREWDKTVHVVEPYRIPQDWTVYDVLDPGHANAFGVLFLAVKPDGDWVAFDEIYEARTDIPELVALWRGKLSGKSWGLGGEAHWAQRSVIDPASKQVHAGMKLNSVRKQLTRAREKAQFRSFDGGFQMYCAPNAMMAGIFAVKALLNVRNQFDKGDPRNGTPRLTVFNTCHHFQREIRRYRYPRAPEGKSVNEVQGPIRKDDHLMSTIRYAALVDFKFVPMHLRPSWGRGSVTGDLFARMRTRKAVRLKRLRQEATDCS